MNRERQFDYDAFVREFRAACQRRGIDPARGANTYQVVHVHAEQRRRAWKPERWWQCHERWLDAPPYHSDTEEAALWAVFVQAYGITALKLGQRMRQAQTAQAAHAALALRTVEGR